jgi:hypothetical protein
MCPAGLRGFHDRRPSGDSPGRVPIKSARPVPAGFSRPPIDQFCIAPRTHRAVPANRCDPVNWFRVDRIVL